MRLWPLSRKALPKQFQNIMGGENTLFQMALKRVSNKDIFLPPLIVGYEDHRFIIKNNCADIQVEPSAIILEPIAKNTACAVIIAALWAQSMEYDHILVLPSDHLIESRQALEQDVTTALKLSKDEDILYFGIKPTHNHTGYGYIISDQKTGKVLSFHEKPNEEKATSLIENDQAVWNSGIFLLPVKKLIENISHLDEILFNACKNALKSRNADIGFLKMDHDLYNQIPEKQFDKVYCEKVQNGRVFPAQFLWNDIGSWDSVFDQKIKDKNKNVISGNITQSNSSNNLVYSDGITIGLSDVQDIIVVATKDAILVANKEKSQNVKDLVQKIEETNKKQTHDHFISYRPWGSFETITSTENYRVLRMKILPGGKLSMQRHALRSESWSVVSGKLVVIKDSGPNIVEKGQTCFALAMERHKLENQGSETVEFIEVQTGIVDDNDIERFDQVY